MSDLHIELWAKKFWDRDFFPNIQTDAEVLILAGDVVSWRDSEVAWSKARLLEFANRYPQIIYVPGNHEFWGTDIETAKRNLAAVEASIPNLQVLRTGEIAYVGKQRFLGDTMWFPRNDDGQKIRDFYVIENFEPQVYEEHARFKSFLRERLTSDDIVVTHHAPSAQSIAECWAGSPANPYFCVPEIESEIIALAQPRLWVHGHMHMSFDYRVGATQVICNPMGYPNEAGPTFKPRLVVEVP